MANKTITKFVFLYEAGNLSFCQNLSAIQKAHYDIPKTVTRLKFTYINAVCIITTFSVKPHLMIICSRLPRNLAAGFCTIHWTTVTHCAYSLSSSYVKYHARFLMINLVHLKFKISFSVVYTRAGIVILATPRQIGYKNCWSDAPMQQEGWILPLPTYIMGAVHHEMGIGSSQLIVSKCRDSV